jgi:hypothetical protein
MAVWYTLWPFGRLFPFWYVWTKTNLATLIGKSCAQAAALANAGKSIVGRSEQRIRVIEKLLVQKNVLKNLVKLKQTSPASRVTRLFCKKLPNGLQNSPEKVAQPILVKLNRPPLL